MNSTEVGKREIRPETIIMLLRSIGASSNFVGFKYIVHIVQLVFENPDEQLLITKPAYPAVAKKFGVRPSSVEHAIRTVIASCWDRYDHSDINRVAGIELEKIPTNTVFITMLVDYLRCHGE